MIKRLRVTVDGVSYDVSVEIADEGAGPAPAAVTAAPVATAAPAPPPPPAPAAAAPAPTSAAAPTSPAGPGDVPSPLAGRVTAVVVKPGQAVKEGDHLLTLEAMKMNTFVFAPKSGSVSELKVAVGDAVDENQVLIKIQ